MAKQEKCRNFWNNGRFGHIRYQYRTLDHLTTLPTIYNGDHLVFAGEPSFILTFIK